MSIQASVEGFDAIDARLAQAQALVRRDLRQAMDASLLLIEAGTKQRLQPYHLTGRSERSVTHSVVDTGNSIMGVVGSSAIWARAFELGRPPGIWPPLAPLVVWVRARHLSGVYSLKSHRRLGTRDRLMRDYQDVQAARGVQRAIYKRGIKPHPALIPAYNAALPRIVTLFQRAGLHVISRVVTGR